MTHWYERADCDCLRNEFHHVLKRDGKAFRSMEIRELIDEYVLVMEIKKFSWHTVTGRKNRLIQFANWAEENGIMNIEEISMATVKEYAKFHSDRGLRGSTINTHLKTVKFFCQYAFDEGYSNFSTKRNWFYVREEKPVLKVPTNDDVKLLIKNCNDGRKAPRHKFKSCRDKTILYTLIETGIRNEELCNIKIEDVNIEQGFITINGKNGKQRLVAITKPLARQLMIYFRERSKYFPDTKEPWLFLSVWKKRLTQCSVEDIFRDRGEGLQNEVSPHGCRHFWTKTSAMNGVSLVVIQRQLGHVNLSITERYLQSLSSIDIVNAAKENSIIMNL